MGGVQTILQKFNLKKTGVSIDNLRAGPNDFNRRLAEQRIQCSPCVTTPSLSALPAPCSISTGFFLLLPFLFVFYIIFRRNQPKRSSRRGILPMYDDELTDLDKTL